jgi:hypothetical protein
MRIADYQFPAALHGTAAGVRKAWGEVARRVWRAGDWDAGLAGLALAPVHTTPGDLIVVPAFNERPGERHWRLYEARGGLFDSAAEQGMDIDRLDRLVCEGADRYLWYALGLFGWGDGGAGPVVIANRGAAGPVEERVYRPLIASLLRWSRAMGPLRHRLSFGPPATGSPFADEAGAVRDRLVMRLAHLCGMSDPYAAEH